MKFISFLYLIMIFALISNAEEIKSTGSITGNVTDSLTKQPVEYANITLYRTKDSVLVQGTVTNTKGDFVIDKLPFNNYYLVCDFIGYKKKFIRNIIVSAKNPKIFIGNIKLPVYASQLSEFTVVGEKKMVEYSLDKKVINVEQNITSQGGTAVDALRNIPSVQVDVDNNVSLRGLTDVVILIDGHPSSISASTLDQIPARSIEDIEIITNPSAKYNPEGMAGIINIKLKKKRNKGFNSSITLGAATHDKYNGSFSLNYNIKKVNLFVSYDTRYDHRPGYGNATQTTFINDTTNSYLKQNMTNYRNSNSNNIKVGADFFINSKNTITLSATLYNNFKSGMDNSLSIFENNNFNFIKQNVSITQTTTNSNAIDYVLNYKKTFDKKGKELTADVIYTPTVISDKDNVSIQNQYQNNTDYGYPEQYKTISDNNLSSLTFQTNFVNPLKNKDSKYELGYQGVIKTNLDNFQYLNFDSINKNWLNDDTLSNKFTYFSQTHAVYGTYTNSFNKFNYQAGLRLEQTFTSSDQTQNNIQYNYNYFNFFPSAHLAYNFSDKQAVQLSYSRRITRPSPSQLNPVPDYSSPLFIRLGNPQLKPQYTNSLELGYFKNWSSTSINSDVFYHEINDVIKRVVTHVDTSSHVTTMTSLNLSSGTSYGVEANVEQAIFKFWKVNVNFSFFRNIIKGDNVSNDLSNSNYSWTSKFSSNTMLPKKFMLQITGYYNGPIVTPQGEIKPLYSIDAALKKDFMKDKRLSISLRVSDIFNTLKFDITSSGENFNGEMIRKRETRVGYISLVYKLGGQQNKSSKKKENNDNGTGKQSGMDEDY